MTNNEARKRWRERMRQEKRCMNCGKQDDKTLAGRSKCAVCARKDNQRGKEHLDANPEKRSEKNIEKRERYQWLKTNHLCIDCKQQDAYTLNGRARCFECAEKYARKCREQRAKAPDKYSKAKRELRATWRENGKCTNCGRKKPSWDHHGYCITCRVKAYNIKKKQRESRDDWFPRGTPGLCYFCLQPVMEGNKVCQRCYDARMPGLAKAREAAKASRDKHVWKRYNEILFGRTKNE